MKQRRTENHGKGLYFHVGKLKRRAIPEPKRGHVSTSGPIYGSEGGNSCQPRRPTSTPLKSVSHLTNEVENEIPYMRLDKLDNPHGVRSYGPVYLSKALASSYLCGVSFCFLMITGVSLTQVNPCCVDIPTGQPSFQNNVFTLRAQTLLHNIFVLGNEKGLASGWKSFQVPKIGKNCHLGINKARQGALMIRAVATLEPKSSVQSDGGQDGNGNLHLGVDSGSASGIQNQSSSEDSEELSEKEKLRRMRISKANKGITPWNKGRKHSPETRQLIKERTWIAMQSEKVRAKLGCHGHAQRKLEEPLMEDTFIFTMILYRICSQETRMKIGAAVRLGWDRRREKLRLQESCYFDWQNLIADASRRGFVGQEELQWDSYKMLSEQLEQEWVESFELKKHKKILKGNRKAPKTLEQRRKISEAITAKWADPEYRNRVHGALVKYHGSRVGVERKPKKQPSVDRQARPPSAPKKKAKETAIPIVKVTKSPKNSSTKPLRRNKPQYKDPLASSKLEMIKNIRAQRAAVETKKTEAIVQAKLLIAEAEMAAKALEAAAMTSPVAQASLIETRKLIAEAIQSLQSIEKGQIHSNETDVQNPSVASADLVNHMEKESSGKINGTQALESRESDIKDFGFGKFNFQYLLNGDDEVLPTTGCDLLNGKEELYRTGSSDSGWSPSELNSVLKQSGITEQLSQLEPNGKNSLQKEVPLGGAELKPDEEVKPPSSITVNKKWVRGKLVEVEEVD
ncbi:hypothetical protein RHSIM_Rhsim08G0245400 [Rhododendron simsii]|uniref:Nuclease associated modular domain-containing protein n=1 Tax=Rhododendron simsii TaxID=118357 RepID=A0A834LHX6_RHOSS|nr:hypothetical protein RHSIM_Rhsim08G0245400 [Rhododendron simsii]